MSSLCHSLFFCTARRTWYSVTINSSLLDAFFLFAFFLCCLVSVFFFWAEGYGFVIGWTYHPFSNAALIGYLRQSQNGGLVDGYCGAFGLARPSVLPVIFF